MSSNSVNKINIVGAAQKAQHCQSAWGEGQQGFGNPSPQTDMIQGCRLVPRACLPTYNTIQWCPELMRDHRQELLLHSHAFLEVLNQLQPTNHKLHNWAVKPHQVSNPPAPPGTQLQFTLMHRV